MARLITLVLLAGTAAALDLKVLCPAYPLCDNELLAYYLKLENPQPAAPCDNFPLCDVNHVAIAQKASANVRRRRSLPVPGTIPGLVPGSAAEAQWYAAQLIHQAQLVQAGRKKRSLPVPGTIPGLVPGSAAEAQWYAAQLIHQAQNVQAGRKKRSLPVPGTIPGLVPGSAAEAQWYQQQLAHRALIAG